MGLTVWTNVNVDREFAHSVSVRPSSADDDELSLVNAVRSSMGMNRNTRLAWHGTSDDERTGRDGTG